MEDSKDETLKVRLPAGLKEDLRDVADRDADTQCLSEWVRRELRAGLRIAQKENADV